MAREVRILTWCDNCAADNNMVEAREYTGLNGAGIKVEVDLCEECAEAFILPAERVLDTFGREPVKVRKPRKPRTETPAPNGGACPECGSEFATKQSLGMHRWRAHGVKGQNKKQAS